MQTFHHRDKKSCLLFVDWFGWCTWDAFYTDVTAEGVKQGLQSLAEGARRRGSDHRRWVAADRQREQKEESSNAVVVQEGAQFASRLTGYKENAKFQRRRRTRTTTTTSTARERHSTTTPGLKLLVEEAKRDHGRQVRVRVHAMQVTGAGEAIGGRDGALRELAGVPGAVADVMGNQPDIVMDSLPCSASARAPTEGPQLLRRPPLVPRLVCGVFVEVVKVDVQNIIETLGVPVPWRTCLSLPKLTHMHSRRPWARTDFLTMVASRACAITLTCSTVFRQTALSCLR
ncbi:hypothetical protein HU200_065942 [Digitaria exilis]|uniref:Uncharacterized protein n=1 Tax=Digitaria exilis TaxID=1010633 RepID=A0A835A1X2_9POAL|nr:hypothetical protein HU200_065942 [Digitaria exilis]